MGSARPGPTWLSRKVNWIVGAVPLVLEGIGVAIGILFVLLLLAHWDWFARQYSRIWIVNRLLSPRLSIDKTDATALGDEKIGPSFLAQLRENLNRFRQEALAEHDETPELDFAPSGEEFVEIVSGDPALKNALEKAQGISDNTKLVAALIDLLYALLPIRKLSVGSVFTPPLGRRARITLAIEEDAQLQASYTLTGKELRAAPKPAAYLELVDSAAVWIALAIADVLRYRRVDRARAESYALVREGLAAHFDQEEAAAREFFEEALAREETNWSAHVNLALTEARLAQDFDKAILILDEALLEMTGGAWAR
jgi:hypothetical protein